MKKSFLSMTVVALIILSCGDKRGKPPQDSPQQEKSGGKSENLSLTSGAEAFSKFECSVKGEPLHPIKRETFQGFTPIPSCPGIRLRQVGSSFATNILKMDVDINRNLFLLIETSDTGDTQKLFGKFSFLKLDPSGKTIFEVKSKDRNVFESFALHPSGETTIVETRKVGSGDELEDYNVWFRRLSSAGQIKFEIPLKETTVDELPRVFFYAGSVLLANGEGAYLTSYTDKGKLYSLNQDLKVDWAYQYLPRDPVFIVPGKSKMFIDKESRLVLAQTVHNDDLISLETKFGWNIPDKNSSGAVIYRFSADGKSVEHKMITSNSSLSLAGIHANANIITLAGDLRIKKFNEPNHTYERDLMFMNFDMLTGEILMNKTVDLQRDDSASGFVIDAYGNGIIVGRNNFVQVDSHSVIEFGQAFILKFNPHGETMSYVSFKGQRNTGIGQVQIVKDSEELYFSGVFYGPITHTGDQDPSLRFQKAMVGQFLF